MRLDPDWRPDQRAMALGRGLGHTTRMMADAIELAQQPHSIILLFPTVAMAGGARQYFADILYSNVPRDEWSPLERHSGRFEVYSSEVAIVPVSTDPGRFLSRGVHSLSIIMDHSCADRESDHPFSNVVWLRAINLVQSLNESRNTIDASRIDIMTSGV